ncbi:hypothetical protein BCV69DRAFT_222318 [Microstroma glucosiphilum]|uniref:Uncharacterized protein n=1 Tax=Pseudomicrostroma glucosiphilum TaxID=1684307 RepID=A0A316U742_9BASI|nr:hypothetical protein BCV69DRAFT_222318 [Pseudomicrostroma glucosiphilum]PWN20173.1 hypothetical protein BCV69DRAFT_222318 [Pseudomicrostroma glucosiphilum]
MPLEASDLPIPPPLGPAHLEAPDLSTKQPPLQVFHCPFDLIPQNLAVVRRETVNDADAECLAFRSADSPSVVDANKAQRIAALKIFMMICGTRRGQMFVQCRAVKSLCRALALLCDNPSVKAASRIPGTPVIRTSRTWTSADMATPLLAGEGSCS